MRMRHPYNGWAWVSKIALEATTAYYSSDLERKQKCRLFKYLKYQQVIVAMSWIH